MVNPAATINDIELDAERCRRSFKHFVREAWDQIDPAPLIWNWHIDVICDHLQAVAEKRIQLLLINIPPGHAKSMLVSVLYPAWMWARNPRWSVMGASYELELANRDAVKSRTLMDTKWYRERFRAKDPWDFSEDQNNKSYYRNTKLGHRITLSVGGRATGYRADCLLVDDPINVAEADSKIVRTKVINWKQNTMSSRFNSLADRTEVVIMQRVHEEDLSGFLLKMGGWQHLCLPSEFETKRRSKTFAVPKGFTFKQVRLGAPMELFFEDPRTEEGEELFPELFPKEVLDETRTTTMGPITYAGQHQQRPMPATGGAMKRSFFSRRWYPLGQDPIPSQDRVIRRQHDPSAHNPRVSRIMVTDAAYKKTDDSDYVAIGVWDIIYPDAFLIDWTWKRMSFLETLNAILALRAKWSQPGMPFVRKLGVEEKANGAAIIDMLKQRVPGVFPIQPLGSKEARVEASAPFLESGNVWMPEGHPQLEDGIAQALVFPKGANDDWVDMLAYGILLGLASNKMGFLQKIAKW